MSVIQPLCCCPQRGVVQAKLYLICTEQQARLSSSFGGLPDEPTLALDCQATAC